MLRNILVKKYFKVCKIPHLSSSNEAKMTEDEIQFRKLELYKSVRKESMKARRQFKAQPVAPPRYLKMPIDQDWNSVWPSARTFHPAVVPLPVRQGYVQKGVPPGKFANAELMKTPNFLHLTPPAIKKHCEAIKKFCTPWPKALTSDEKCEKYFPIEFISSDYCSSSPSIRDCRARIVTLKIHLSDLDLDYHAKDKLVRLLRTCYNSETDVLTLTAERCPLRIQNYDYVKYLLTVLFHESWKIEPWESEKTEADMEKFFFENSRIEQAVVDLISKTFEESDSLSKDEILKKKEMKEYAEAVSNLINEGENDFTLGQYKNSVFGILKYSMKN